MLPIGADSATRDRVAISVAVCTRNRARRLAGTLAAFERIRTRAAWELIVVDNASSDDTGRVIQAFVARRRLPMRPLFNAKPGLSAARNLALRQASGAIICFTDDDCYPTPDWIDSWLRVFRDGNIDYAGGRVELFDPTDAPITIQLDLQPHTFPPYTYIPPGQLHGANMAFRRELVSRVGYFDESLGAGSRFYAAEDTDYFQRASDAGFVGAYRPEPMVAHHHGRKLVEMRLLQRGYQISSGALRAKRLLHHRTMVRRHIADWWSDQSSLTGAIKSLYWAQRRDFLWRNWNISRGFIGYLVDSRTGLSSAGDPQSGLASKSNRTIGTERPRLTESARLSS